MQPVLIAIAGFALLAALLAWSRWLAGRRWAAVGHLLFATGCAAAVSVGWPLVKYLDTYEVRVAERPVADVFFERAGPNRFRVALTRLPAGRMQVVELVGDQWRLDLHTLDWSSRTSGLGLEPRFRIETLASRPAPAAANSAATGVTHQLAAGDDQRPWLADLGAGHGGALTAIHELPGPWLPMVDGARFVVRLTARNVIEVEPLNETAADSLDAG